MLNYYDSRNKEEDQLLDTDIVMVIDSPYQTSSTFYNWKITRHRTKQYKFVGMDRATARACLAAKRAQYQRDFYMWQFNSGKWTRGSSPAYSSRVASVTPERLTGSMWNVVIRVDETCICYVVANASGQDSQGHAIDPAAAVDTYCNSSNWSYDET